MPDCHWKLRTLALIVLVSLTANAKAETPPSHLYFRGVKTHQRALEIIEANASRRKSDAVVVVLMRRASPRRRS